MKVLNLLPVLATLLLAAVNPAEAVVGNPPVADAGPNRPDQTAGEAPLVLPPSGSLSVTLNGYGTSDADNDIVSLVWTLGTTTRNGYNPTFTFTATGTYTIHLTVTDSENNVSTDAVTVTISRANGGPTTLVPASNLMVECDGAGNLTQLNTWLATQGGAVAPPDCGAVTWTHNYTGATLWQSGVSPVCEQVPVTFTATFADGNVATTTALFQIKDTTAPPLNWSINGSPVADFTIRTVPFKSTVTVKVVPNDLCGGSTLQKSYAFLSGSGTIAYSSSVGGTSNDTITLTSASVNAKIRFYFKATDECGNSSATEWVEIDVDNKLLALKGNEGVGNGIDPDTPGALHNGNNDAPGFVPGNPGARHKHL